MEQDKNIAKEVTELFYQYAGVMPLAIFPVYDEDGERTGRKTVQALRKAAEDAGFAVESFSSKRIEAGSISENPLVAIFDEACAGYPSCALLISSREEKNLEDFALCMKKEQALPMALMISTRGELSIVTGTEYTFQPLGRVSLLPHFELASCIAFLHGDSEETAEQLIRWAKLANFKCDLLKGIPHAVAVFDNYRYGEELFAFARQMTRRFHQTAFLYMDQEGMLKEYGMMTIGIGPVSLEMVEAFYSRLLGEDCRFEGFEKKCRPVASIAALAMMEHIYGLMKKYEDWDVRFEKKK